MGKVIGGLALVARAGSCPSCGWEGAIDGFASSRPLSVYDAIVDSYVRVAMKQPIPNGFALIRVHASEHLH
jgi:hypothetical protein